MESKYLWSLEIKMEKNQQNLSPISKSWRSFSLFPQKYDNRLWSIKKEDKSENQNFIKLKNQKIKIIEQNLPFKA